jgi:hypothetical protein
VDEAAPSPSPSLPDPGAPSPTRPQPASPSRAARAGGPRHRTGPCVHAARRRAADHPGSS